MFPVVPDEEIPCADPIFKVPSGLNIKLLGFSTPSSVIVPVEETARLPSFWKFWAEPPELMRTLPSMVPILEDANKKLKRPVFVPMVKVLPDKTEKFPVTVNVEPVTPASKIQLPLMVRPFSDNAGMPVIGLPTSPGITTVLPFTGTLNVQLPSLLKS